MTQEEKARRYDEALERARELYGKYCINNALEIIFPELKESEDEEIRQDIINYINVAHQILPQFMKDKWIAWLEKQKPIEWSEEDEIGSDETIELLEYFNNYAPEFRKQAIKRSIDWLNSLKQRMEE